MKALLVLAHIVCWTHHYELKPNKTEKLTDLKATIKHGNSVAFVQLEKKAFINLKVGRMDEVESL